MKKLFCSFLFVLSIALGASAGTLSKWSLYNFQGTWEISSTDYDQNLNWLVNRFYGTYIGDPKIDRVTLSLDYNGYGSLEFFSGEMSGKISVCGTIFVPHPEESCYECLSLLCTTAAYDPLKGLNSIYVYALDGDSSDKDGFSIASMNHQSNAKAIKTSSDPSGIAEVKTTSILIQYQDNGISVRDAETSAISVYGIDGVMHYKTKSYKGETIPLNKGAIYVVRVGDNSMKISYQ